MVILRLARHGRTHKAFYHLVAADSRKPRDGRYLEMLGTWDPHTKTANLKVEAILGRLSHGAQMSDTVKELLAREGILKQATDPAAASAAAAAASAPATEAAPATA